MRNFGRVRNDAIWKYFGSLASGATLSLLGQFIEARAYLENNVSLWDATTYRAIAPSPEDPHVRALIYLSRTLLCLGYIDQARLRRDEALAEARRLSPYTLVYALTQAWYGDWSMEGLKSAQTTLRSADEVLTISSEQGDFGAE